MKTIFQSDSIEVKEWAKEWVEVRSTTGYSYFSYY